MSNKTSLDKQFNIATAGAADSWPTASGVPTASVYAFGDANKLTETISALVSGDVVEFTSGQMIGLKSGTPVYGVNMLSSSPNATTAASTTTFTIPLASAPPANRVTVLFIYSNGSTANNTVAPTSVTGANMTWNQVGTFGNGVRRLSMYVAAAPTSAAPTSASIVATFSVSQSNVAAICYSMSGTNAVSSTEAILCTGIFATGTNVSSTTATFATTAVDSSTLGGINMGFVLKNNTSTGGTYSGTGLTGSNLTLANAVGSISDFTTTGSSTALTYTTGAAAWTYITCRVYSHWYGGMVNVPLVSTTGATTADVSPVGTYQYSMVAPAAPAKTAGGASSASTTYIYFFGEMSAGKLLNYYYASIGFVYSNKNANVANSTYALVGLYKVENGVTTLIGSAQGANLIDRAAYDVWDVSVETSPSGSGLYTIKITAKIPASVGGAPAETVTYTSTALSKYSSGDCSGVITPSRRGALISTTPAYYGDIKSLSINDISVSNIKPAMQGISRSANW